MRNPSSVYTVPRPYYPLPILECEEAYYPTFKFQLTTGTWYNGHGTVIQAADTVVPVLVDATTDSSWASDGNTYSLSDYALDPMCITFTDSVGRDCDDEPVIFDPANKRYKWWVNVEGTNFANDGILYLKIKPKSTHLKEQVFSFHAYKNQKLIPIHAGNEYVEVNELPTVSNNGATNQEATDQLYKGIHTLLFGLTPNPDFDWEALRNEAYSDAQFPRAYPLLRFGPVIVYVWIHKYWYTGQLNPMHLSIKIANGRIASSGLPVLLDIERDYVATANNSYKFIYPGGDLTHLCLVNWVYGENLGFPGYVRIPKNASTGGHNNEPVIHAIAYATEYATQSTSPGGITCYTNSTESDLENVKLELHPEMPELIARDGIKSIDRTTAPLKVVELRFEADRYLYPLTYEPSEDYGEYAIDYENDTYHYTITDNSEGYYKNLERLMTLRNIWNTVSSPQFVVPEDGVSVAPTTPPLPYPNNIQMTYQGFSGEQYL